MIQIRGYKTSDLKELERMFNEQQDYIVEVDDIGRNRRDEGFGEHFAKETIEETKGDKGVIYMAEDEKGQVIGFSAGVINLPNDEDLLGGNDPRSWGRVTELFVNEKFRGKGVGRLLMEKLEDYFKKRDCGFIRVEVFEPNKNAHGFYKKLGFSDRNIDMLKLL